MQLQYPLSSPDHRPSSPIGRLAAFLAPVILSILTACGGGGGGGAAEGQSTPTPPTTPGTPAVAALQPADATSDAALTTTLAEQTLMVAQLAGDQMREQAGRGGLVAAGIACHAGEGTRDVVVDDRDASGGLTTGDRLHIQFSACRVLMFEGLLSGAIEIEVVPSTLTPAAGAWAAELSTDRLTVARDGAASPRVLTGHMHVESRMDLDSVVVQADSSDADADGLVWQLDGPSTNERMLDVKLAKTLDHVDSSGRVDIAYTLDSDRLGGSVTVASGNDGITGWIGRLPDAGVLRISGKGEIVLQATADGDAKSVGVGFDGDGNGSGVAGTPVDKAWTNFTTGFLWWAQGLVPLSESGAAYRIPSADLPPLARYGDASSSELALNPIFEWTFSIDLDPRKLPVLVLERDPATQALPWSRADDDWGSQRVVLQPTLRGARLTLKPAEQLQPGRTYRLRMLGSVPSGPTEDAAIEGTHHDTIVLLDVFETRASLLAAANFTPVPAVTPAFGDLSIDATASFDGTQPITYAWRQLDGPTLAIDSPSSPTTLVRLAGAASASDQQATLELTVTNAAGEKDVALLPVTLLAAPSPVPARQLYFRSSPGSEVGNGETRRITGPGVAFTAQRPSPDRVELEVVEPGGTRWSWRFAPPAGQALMPGTYGSDADTDFRDASQSRTPTPSASRTELLEIEFGAGGEVTRLAADFFHDTGGLRGSVSGSLRFNSSLPARP